MSVISHIALFINTFFWQAGGGALLLGMVAFGTNLSVKLWGGNSYHLIVQYIVYFKKDFGLLIQHVVFIFVFFVGVGEQPLFHWWGDCLIMYLINWLIKYFKTDCYLKILVHWYLVAVLRTLHEIVHWQVVW